MTRTTRTAGDRLRAMREAAGFTLVDTYVALKAGGNVPGRYLQSVSTIQRMEKTETDEDWNGVLVVALAELYRCKVSDISPAISDESSALADLLSRSTRCTDPIAA